MIRILATTLLLFVAGPAQKNKRLIVLAEQSQHRLAIVDVDQQKIVWEWSADSSSFVPQQHKKWFSSPDDAKPVYDCRYLLTTASGGVVALIRIADKKPVFYAYAGGNPHSAELLPDGNIVCASSTGNFLTLFKVDTTVDAESVQKWQIPIAFGHNVVWDKKRRLLWSAANDHMLSYRYNNSCDAPSLTLQDSIAIPGTDAHDLFPDFDKDRLWLTNTKNVYLFDVAKQKIITTDLPQKNIKSVSSGPGGYPTITMHPQVKWWSDEVLDAQQHSVFRQEGLKIYKARWMLPNYFSYPRNDRFRYCN
jgi:hypothetical protein